MRTLELLETAKEHWDECLEADASSAEQLTALHTRLDRRGLVVDGRPLCGVLRPHLITPELLALQSAAARLVVSAAERVRDWLLADERLTGLHLARFQEWIGDLLEMDGAATGEGSLMRLDASLARTRLHFIELNADTPLGVGHNDAIASFFCELETYARFGESYETMPLLMEGAMLKTVLSVWSRYGGKGKPKVTIVARTDDPLVTSSARVDVENYRLNGLEAELIDFRDLTYSCGKLRSESGEIELVHRILPIADCLEHRQEMQPLLDATAAGAICMLNPFRSELLGHKTIFALMTDPALDFGFSSAQQQAVRDHVPWGRPLRDDHATDPAGADVELPAYVAANQHRLVLKPAHSYGGRDVHLGWRMDASEWERCLSQALESDYIVQERVELHRHSYPTLDAPGSRADYYEDTDPFMFEGRPGGTLSRLSPSELTNVHAGGSVVPTFVVEPRS